MTSRLAAAAALAPVALAWALAALWQAGSAPNPILFLRADAATVLLAAGALLSLSAGIVLLIDGLQRRRQAAAVSAARGQQAETHRSFIRRLDHEIKNPLTAIRAAMANLNEQCDDATLASLRAQVDRLARLSGDLRKITEMETQPLETEEVQLGSVLGEVMQMARSRPKAASCRLSLRLPEAPWPLPPVLGDRDLLFIAFYNLVDNALKYCSDGAAVEVRAYDDGPSVIVEVADTGPGIEPGDLPHLGEELYRGVGAISTEGSGLGLALVRAVAARHQGTMTVRSRAGQGTVVALRLPAAHVDAQAARP